MKRFITSRDEMCEEDEERFTGRKHHFSMTQNKNKNFTWVKSTSTFFQCKSILFYIRKFSMHKEKKPDIWNQKTERSWLQIVFCYVHLILIISYFLPSPCKHCYLHASDTASSRQFFFHIKICRICLSHDMRRLDFQCVSPRSLPRTTLS